MGKGIKVCLLFVVLLIIHLLFVIFIQKSLYPIHLSQQNFFLLDLIHKTSYLPNAFIYIFESGNLLLLWSIGKKFFKSFQALIPPAIYAISPWGSYLTAAGSFYISLLFLILFFVYSLLLLREDSGFWRMALFLIASLIAVYSSLFFLILIPLILALVIILKLVPSRCLKKLIILFTLLTLPLLFIIIKNNISFKSVVRNEVEVFADPGLINTVNSYQGESRKENLSLLSRISENKYFFSAEYILAKSSQQLAPSTFFTSQGKLLNFSFSSPIFLAFIIPFLYGTYLLLKLSDARKIFFISSLLLVPSLLAQEFVDLNRLIIFMPIILFVISYGIIKFLEKKNKKMIYISIFLLFVVLQMLITIFDIKIREKARFMEYYGQSFEIKDI